MLITLLTFESCSKNSLIHIEQDPFFQKFDGDWKLYLESSYGGWKNNDLGRFSWDDAYALEGLCLNYKRSYDDRYLDTFIKVSRTIFSNSDLKRQIFDKYRSNKILHGWSSRRYINDSTYHIFGVTNSMILLPIIEMYNISKTRLNKGDTRLIFLLDAIEFAKKEFEEIEENDYVIINDSTGLFHDPYYRAIGIQTPVNQFSRVGSYSLELFLATSDKKYYNYSKNVANLIKQNLHDTLNYVYWHYFPFSDSLTNSYEDLSHSILVIQFILKCFENGLVFEKNDINKLVNLFNYQLYSSSSKKFREYLVGNKLSVDPIFSHYFLLSQYDKSILNKLNEWMLLNPLLFDSNSFLNHFGNKLILNNAYKNYFAN